MGVWGWGGLPAGRCERHPLTSLNRGCTCRGARRAAPDQGVSDAPTRRRLSFQPRAGPSP